MKNFFSVIFILISFGAKAANKPTTGAHQPPQLCENAVPFKQHINRLQSFEESLYLPPGAAVEEILLTIDIRRLDSKGPQGKIVIYTLKLFDGKISSPRALLWGHRYNHRHSPYKYTFNKLSTFTIYPLRIIATDFVRWQKPAELPNNQPLRQGFREVHFLLAAREAELTITEAIGDFGPDVEVFDMIVERIY